MPARLRIHLALLLAALLILTGQGLAMARGSTGPVGQMVLCTGSGPVVVFVDETGRPTGPPHFCPDFALHVIADAVLPVAAGLPVPPRPAMAPPPAPRHAAGRPIRAFRARGPPRSV